MVRVVAGMAVLQRASKRPPQTRHSASLACLLQQPATSLPAHYAALIVAFVAAAVGPATLMEACAHFLPAVVRSLGVQRWHQLRCAGVWATAGRVIESYPMSACRGCPSAWLLSCPPHSAFWPLLSFPTGKPLFTPPACCLLYLTPAAGRYPGNWRLLSTCQCGLRWRRACTSWRQCWGWS
jgi:hypothetical protein